MIILWIYVAVLVILFIAYYVIHKHEQQIARSVIRQIDALIYAFDSTIYHNYQKIFDFSTAQHLLFHNQKEFFAQGKNYADILPKIIHDILYVSDLTHTQPISQEFSDSLMQTYGVRTKIQSFKKQTHIIIIILTLGIGKIILP